MKNPTSDDYSGSGFLQRFWYKNLLGIIPYKFRSPRGYIIKARRRYEIRMCHKIFAGTHYPVALIHGPIRNVLDVGADIGVFTFYCADTYAETLERIISLEPFTTNYRRIVSTVNENSLASKIKPINKAAGEAQGEGNLRLGAAHYSHSLNAEKLKDPKGTQSVGITTLNDVMRESGVKAFDLVKIDVEGSELGVIKSADAVLATARHLLIEAHPGFCSLGDLKRVLAPFGLKHVWPEGLNDEAHGDFLFSKAG